MKTEIRNGRRKGTQRYVVDEFASLCDEIKKTRITLGKDDPNKVKADWRITLAMVRHPSMQKIKEDVINADLD